MKGHGLRKLAGLSVASPVQTQSSFRAENGSTIQLLTINCSQQHWEQGESVANMYIWRIQYLKSIATFAVAFNCASSMAQWTYVNQIDKFTGDSDFYVKLKSKNSQMVGTSSQSVTVELIVFDSSKADTFKAALMFSRHALPASLSYRANYCAGSYTCNALLKIDDGEIVRIPMIDSGKGDKAFVYLRPPYIDTLPSILEAKKLKCELSFITAKREIFSLHQMVKIR